MSALQGTDIVSCQSLASGLLSIAKSSADTSQQCPKYSEFAHWPLSEAWKNLQENLSIMESSVIMKDVDNTESGLYVYTESFIPNTLYYFITEYK